MQAWFAAMRIEEARSLDPDTIRAKALTERQTLYRIAQSGGKTPPGIWWFTEKLAQRCRDEAGADPQERLDWLRDVLAVCFNWSRFDGIERMALHDGESIPAVLGRGLAMPRLKAVPYVDRKTGQKVIDIPADYWKQEGAMLSGGELQVVLPWIPVNRIAASMTLGD